MVNPVERRAYGSALLADGLDFGPIKQIELAWSTAICAVVQAWLLARALGARLEPMFRSLLPAIARIAVASVCTAGAAWAALLWCAGSSALVQCSVAICSGIVVYGALRPIVTRGWTR